jgi:glycosyltransferase involved in cell wall biosynthesis
MHYRKLNKIKVAHLSYGDGHGGAQKAALGIHLSLKKLNNIFSSLYVIKKKTKYSKTFKRNFNIFFKFQRIIIEKIVNLPKLFFFTNLMTSSSSIYNSGWDKFFNSSNFDIINLHWINRETISIEEIGRINKPLVWSLHDMWAFCGGENISENKRYIYGYNKKNMPINERGFDFNRWLWNRKLKNWKNNINLVVPSRWLFKCVKSSKLMKNFNTAIIPYPIKKDLWGIMDKNRSKKILNLNIKLDYILIVMSYGESGWKGGDLFLNTLNYLKKIKFKNFKIILLGNPNKEFKLNLKSYGFEVHDYGYVDDIQKQKTIYNACELVVIPSRYDNLPMVGIEASFCGLPIVAFNVCGLKDLVIHKKTGWLAKPFNIKDLANGIIYILNNNKNKKIMKNISRLKAIEKYDEDKIAKKYMKFYSKILKSS